MRRGVSILIVLALAGPILGGVESLRERSPFIPASVVPEGAGGNALSGLELTGILSVGGKLQFSVRDTGTGRSVWLGIGETQDGLTVRSYEEGSGSVVIEGRGSSRSLVLREARVATAQPVPIAVMPSQPGPIVVMPSQPQGGGTPKPVVLIPATPPGQLLAGPAQPKTTAQAERDARLLVSDLMEISIQERKRYEERMKRQAAGLPPEDPPSP